MPRRASRALVSSARLVRWRRLNTSQRIRRLGVDGHEKVLLRTGYQPIDGAFVLRSRSPDKAIVPPVEPLDIEHLSRFHPVHLTEFCRQNDLALGGYGSLHKSKISTYLRPVKHFLQPRNLSRSRRQSVRFERGPLADNLLGKNLHFPRDLSKLLTPATARARAIFANQRRLLRTGEALPVRSEPPRVLRRLFGLSYATSAGQSSEG